MFQLGHVEQDVLPVLQELLFADHVVAVQIKRLKKSFDSLPGMVDIARKGLVEDVNQFELTFGDPTILADVKLGKDCFCLLLLVHL